MFHEFSYFWFKDGDLMITDLDEVPPDVDFLNLYYAHRQIRLASMQGNYHQNPKPSTLLAIAALRWAVANHGEIFPLLYRGVRSSRPDSEYSVLFATPDIGVAKFYGDVKVKEYKNIKGIKFNSHLKSVVTEDYDHIDVEVVFFNDIN
jgi:hypothetical protein